jgi:UDP-N-acetylglucosamine 4,6-dehydratase
MSLNQNYLINKDLNAMSLLITGGTGSFGQAFAQEVLSRYPEIKKVVIYSRDELKQYEMRNSFHENALNKLRFFIGDIRDHDRLRRAMEGIDIVVHAAALKQVPAAEYNPFECIKTNVIGAQNVIEASLDTKVKCVVALSTDKAAAPINLYGATKLCSDKLFIAANNIKGTRPIRFSVVRYGNVMGSRGSVIPFFLKFRKNGYLPITDPQMTRFNITLAEGVEMVIWTIFNSLGGEVFVPKIPSYKILDLAEAVAPECEHRIVGIRPGEKLHEEMITSSDSLYTINLPNYFAILPSSGNYTPIEHASKLNGSFVKPGFSYSSGDNEIFLNPSQLKKLIEKNIVTFD